MDREEAYAAEALKREHGLSHAILVARQRSRAVPFSNETRFWGRVVVVLIGQQLESAR